MTVELRFASAAAPAVAPAALRAKNVPPHMFAQQIVTAAMPHVPDEVKKRAGGDLVGMYKICVSTEGTVTSVATLQSIPGADDAIMATLRTWQLKPQPIPICSISRFVLSVDHTAHPR